MMKTRMRTAACVVLAGLALIQAKCTGPAQDPAAIGPIIGVKIYEHEGDWASLFAQWEDLRINTVFAGRELNEDAEFRQLCRSNHIARFIIFPVFYDPEALDADTSLHAVTGSGDPAEEDWVRFVCPSRDDFRRSKIETAGRLVRDLQPDGLSLDFIRFFVFWEMVGPERTLSSMANTCFDAACRARFARDTGLAVPETASDPSSFAHWVMSRHLETWVEWKCALIADMVSALAEEARRVRPDVLINLHAVPWREEDFGGAVKIIAGQDFERLAALVDYLSPMTYAHMLRRPPSWVHDVTVDLAGAARKRCAVLPSIQVGKAYRDEDLTADEFGEVLKAALVPPSAGVVFWSWEALDTSDQKKGVVKSILEPLNGFR